MSQSPVDNFSPTATAKYLQGWKALYRLIHEGRSFSGHERNCAFLNILGSDGSGRFADVSAVSGLDFADDARALVLTDWDFDGKLDVWIANRTAPRLRLMRNVMPTAHHFLAMRLIGDGRATNRDAIGARVEVRLSGESARPLIKTLHAGDAFLSQAGSWLHFGLGENSSIDEVVVRWPGGETLRLGGLVVDQRYVVSQSNGTAQLWEPPTGRSIPVASAAKAAQTDEAARTVLPTRLLLPNVFTHEDPSPLNSRLEGPTLITVWSATCAPCIRELRELTKHADRLREAGLDVSAVNLDHLLQPTADADAVLERLGFSFRAEHGTQQLVKILDEVQRSVFDLRRDLATPTSFLIDAAGSLAVIYRGPVSIHQLLADVRLLSESAVALRSAATPFAGRWYSAPPATDPMRLVSQLVDSDMLDAAIEYLQKYVDLLRESPDMLSAGEARGMHYVLGVLLQSRGNADAAISAFRRAQQLDPNDVRVRKELATLFAKAGQFDAAAEQMSHAVSISPDDVDSLRMLAMLRMAQRRFPEAIRAFERVVHQEPGDVQSHYNLANAYRAVGEFSEAIKRYESIVDRQPQMELAANNLAWIRATHPDDSLRDGRQAMRLATRVCAESPHENSLDTLAAAQAETGEFEQAVATLNRAIALVEKKSADADQLQALRSRLELYRRGQPYREKSAIESQE